LTRSNISCVPSLNIFLGLYRLDELASQMTNYMPEDPDLRSPSPDPIYDNQGKRINTREVRKRDNFIRERISLIEDCMKMRKTYFLSYVGSSRLRITNL
jgi:splicing factor 1